MTEATENVNFRDACCRYFDCERDEWESYVFRECLYGHARLLWWLFRWMNPSAVESDYEFLRFIGGSTESKSIMNEAAGYHYENRMRRGYLRNKLKMRLSGERLIQLSIEVFGEKGEFTRRQRPKMSSARRGKREPLRGEDRGARRRKK